MNYRKIEIQMLPSLTFSKNDPLLAPEDKKEREHQLVSATALTMTEHEEVGLILRLSDGEEVEVVSSHIEYEGDFVELKGGYIIPLKAIVKVEM